MFSTCTCTDLLQFANAGIRLAGATSDVHIMDVRTGKWEKMVPHGEPPSPRAAHAAAAVGSMVVVQVSFLPMLTRVSICRLQPLFACSGWNWASWFSI